MWEMSGTGKDRKGSITRMKENNKKKSKKKGNNRGDDEEEEDEDHADKTHGMNTAASPRHTVIIKLTDSDHNNILPQVLGSLRAPPTDSLERRRSSIAGLSKLRDLAYDAENKKLMMKSEYGAIDTVLKILKEDKEEPRCKALGFINTMLISNVVNRQLADNEEVITVLVEKVLTEDIHQFDDDIKLKVELLEEKWNTTPTTFELQRDIKAIRKDIQDLRAQKAFLEEARNVTLAILIKMFSLDENVTLLGTKKEYDIVKVLCHVALTEIMEIRLKAVELLLALATNEDTRSVLISDYLDVFLQTLIQVMMDAPPFEARVKALEAVKNIILVKKDIRKNLVSEEFNFMPVMVTILKKDGELMLTKHEELSSNVNRITILELDIDNIKARRTMELDLLIILAEDEEIAKAYGSSENSKGLLAIMVDILVQSVGKYKEKEIIDGVIDGARMRVLSLLHSVSYDVINKERMGDQELGLMDALAGVIKQKEDIRARLEACAILSSLASLADNTQKMVKIGILPILVDVLSADKGEGAVNCLECLEKIARIEENRLPMIIPDTYESVEKALSNVLDQVLADEHAREESTLKAVSELKKTLAPTKSAFENPPEPPKGDKKARKSKKRISRMGVGMKKSPESLPKKEDANAIPIEKGENSLRMGEVVQVNENETMAEPSTQSKSENQEGGASNEQEDHISDTINLCIDEEMGGNEDEEDEDEYEEDDDGNELRPVRPTEAKPSKEVNPRRMSFRDSKLSMWEYLGYSNKPKDDQISEVHI